jgi:RimJ/RimL family protein N-acetyltransferase
MGPSLAMVSFFIPQWLRTITVAGEQMQSFVNALADNENAWLITEKQSGACIGYVTMDIPYPQLAIGETGYVIGEKYQRKGVGKCAKRY